MLRRRSNLPVLGTELTCGTSLIHTNIPHSTPYLTYVRYVLPTGLRVWINDADSAVMATLVMVLEEVEVELQERAIASVHT